MAGQYPFDVNDFPDVPPGRQVPADYVEIAEPLPRWIDKKLGYFGDARFVLFYYEPRGDGVVWNDGRSHGFGAGAWCFFLDRISPLIDVYEVNLGSSLSEGPHVLVLDRLTGRAYFALREEAQHLVARQNSSSQS